MMRRATAASFIALLVVGPIGWGSGPARRAHAQQGLPPIQVLGIEAHGAPAPGPRASPRPGPAPTPSPAGGAGPARAASPARRAVASTCGGTGVPVDRTALAARLHATGRRKALIIRAGNLGIDLPIQEMVGRIARALEGDSAVSRFLREYLERPYLTDDKAVTRSLESLGYDVVHLTTADSERAGRLARFKDDVLAALRDPATAVVVFYGHSSPTDLTLVGDLEHAAPGPNGLARRLSGQTHTRSHLSVDEIRTARGSNLLDALVLHGCQGATETYLAHEGGRAATTFADCVKPGVGFFAGWVTYAVYFTPHTDRILDAYACHAARTLAGAAPRGPRPFHYYVRTGGIYRTMARLAGLDDDEALRAYGTRVTLASVDRDPDVHAHVEELGPVGEALDNILGFLHNVRHGDGTLAGDVERFVRGYHRYLARNGIPLDRDGGPAPILSGNPSIEELNRVLAYHLLPILREAMEAVAPGLASVRRGSVRLDPADGQGLHVELAVDVGSSAQVDDLLAVLRSVHEARVRSTIETGIGGSIGPQVAGRLREALDRMRSRLPGTTVRLRLTLSLTKIVAAGHNRIRPTVHGMVLGLGEVPDRYMERPTAPYQILIDLGALERLAGAVLSDLVGDEIDLTWNGLHAATRMQRLLGLRRWDSRTLHAPMDWQVRVNWGILGDGFARSRVTLLVRAEPAQGLAVRLTPSVRVQLLDGWPVRRISSMIARRAVDAIDRRIQAAAASPVDFGALVPGVFAPEVVGRVRIEAIGVGHDVVSVRIVHAP